MFVRYMVFNFDGCEITVELTNEFDSIESAEATAREVLSDMVGNAKLEATVY